MRAVLLQAKFSGGAFRAPHETANAPPPRILRLRRKTAPKMKNRSRDPHHAPKGAADFAARRRQIILIVFGATCACQKTLLTERSVRACGACMQRSAISSKKEDGFRRPLFLRGMRSAAAHAPQARTEIGEAPPVADEANRFRGTGTIGAPERARQS